MSDQHYGRARRRLEEKYQAELGADALERQRVEAVERHPCCGERVDEGHHPMCSKRPPDEPAPHIEGQQGLL